MNISSTQYDLERILNRLEEEMKTEPFEKLLLAVLYTSKLFDKYMDEPYHKLAKRRQFYAKFESLCGQLETKIINVTTNQYLMQKQNKKAILNQISFVLDKYTSLRNGSASVSLILQTTNPNPTKLNVIQPLISSLKLSRKHYQEHRIDEAYKLVQNVKIILQNNIHIKQKMTMELNNQMNRIQADYMKANSFRSYLNDEKDWILEMKSDQSQLYFKVYQEQLDSNSTLAIKIQGNIQIQLKTLLMKLLEPQLLSSYIPFVKRSEDLKNICSHLPANIKTGKFSISIPYYVDNKLMSFYLMLFDELATHRSFLIIAESLQESKEMQERLEVKREDREEDVRLHYCCIEVQPLSQSTARVKLVARPHFKLEFFDFEKLKKAARIFHSHFLSNLSKVEFVKELRWKELIKSNQNFNQLLQRSIDLFLKQRK